MNVSTKFNKQGERNEKRKDILKNYLKRESNEYQIKLVSLSPKKANVKKRFSVLFIRSNSIDEKMECSKKWLYLAKINILT